MRPPDPPEDPWGPLCLALWLLVLLPLAADFELARRIALLALGDDGRG
jgi:hypothetical protein